MKKAAFKTEAELAAQVIIYLREQGWEIYQEVPCWSGCCDIVATRGPLLWAIECKLRLGFEVIGQARRWAEVAHLASVAVPGGASNNSHAAAGDLLGLYGLSMIEAWPEGSSLVEKVRELTRPKLRRRVLPRLRDALCEEHKTYAAAGSAGHRVWTPFKATCRNVQRVVEKEPGITLKELMGRVSHHYASDSSARACILHSIEGGLVEGVRLEREGKGIRLFSTIATNAGKHPPRRQVLEELRRAQAEAAST